MPTHNYDTIIASEREAFIMPIIMPIRDLRKTSEISELAHKKLELFPKSHQDRLVGRYAGKGYKQLIIDNYIAIFKVDENKKKVFVLTVQYQGRQM